jgi:hypothetical protein
MHRRRDTGPSYPPNERTEEIFNLHPAQPLTFVSTTHTHAYSFYYHCSTLVPVPTTYNYDNAIYQGFEMLLFRIEQGLNDITL